MDLENQKRVKEFAEEYGPENVVVIVGAAEGEAAGLEKGRAEGETAGQAAATLKLARNFKNAGISAEVIAENTGLSLAEIEKLCNRTT